MPTAKQNRDAPYIAAAQAAETLARSLRAHIRARAGEQRSEQAMADILGLDLSIVNTRVQRVRDTLTKRADALAAIAGELRRD